MILQVLVIDERLFDATDAAVVLDVVLLESLGLLLPSLMEQNRFELGSNKHPVAVQASITGQVVRNTYVSTPDQILARLVLAFLPMPLRYVVKDLGQVQELGVVAFAKETLKHVPVMHLVQVILGVFHVLATNVTSNFVLGSVKVHPAFIVFLGIAIVNLNIAIVAKVIFRIGDAMKQVIL